MLSNQKQITSLYVVTRKLTFALLPCEDVACWEGWCEMVRDGVDGWLGLREIGEEAHLL